MKKNYEGQCKACRGLGHVVKKEAEVLCNMCGGSMRVDEDYGDGNAYFNGLVDARVGGGYHSYHLFDMTTYSFDMCEQCLRKMFIQFKIPPLVNDNMDRDATWEQDQQYYEYRLWKDNGGHHQAYLNGLCNNAITDCPGKAIYTVKHIGESLEDGFTEDCCCDNEEHQYCAANQELVPFISNVLKPFL